MLFHLTGLCNILLIIYLSNKGRFVLLEYSVWEWHNFTFCLKYNESHMRRFNILMFPSSLVKKCDANLNWGQITWVGGCEERWSASPAISISWVTSNACKWSRKRVYFCILEYGHNMIRQYLYASEMFQNISH